MIEKGTLVVRTEALENGGSIPKFKKQAGYIFKTIENNGSNIAMYASFNGIIPSRYRRATDLEKEYFERGWYSKEPNIKDMGELEGYPVDFIEVMLTRQVMAGNARDITVFQYNRCASRKQGGFDWNVPDDSHWQAWSNALGKKSYYDSEKPLEERLKLFYDFYNPKNHKTDGKSNSNDKAGETSANRHSSQRGRAISSNPKRQVASASRLVGNTTRAKFQRTRVGTVKVSSRAIRI